MVFKAAFGASSCNKTVCIIIGVSCRFHFSHWRVCARKPFHVETAPPATEQAESSSNPLSFVAETHPICVLAAGVPAAVVTVVTVQGF